MADQDKLKIFISYSRDDLKFADQLDAALDLTGFECTIDRHGIHGGEDWKQRLGNLILETDTVVFVLSPTSAVSKICEWEVNEAARLGKRILPVLCRPLEGTDPPARLRDLNYIYFYDEPKSPGSGFGAGLAALVAALNTDLDWLREHTRLLERANEWVASGRQETALLFGSSIAEAKAWIERRTKSAPEITPLHIEFIRSSEEAESRRQDTEHQRLKAIEAAQGERAKAIADRESAQKREIEASRTVVRRTKIGLVAVSVLAAVASGVGFYAYKQRDVALQQTEAATSHLERAAQTSSLFRASQARRALERNDVVAAAEVALSGVPDEKSREDFERKRPFFPEAFHALHQAWTRLNEKAVLSGHQSSIRGGAIAPDGSYFVTISDDGMARIWDKEGKALRILQGHASGLTSIAVSPDGSFIVLGSQDQKATIWARDGAFKARLDGHRGGLTSVAVSPDGQRVLTTSRDREARIWDTSGAALATLAGHTGVVTSGVFSADGQRVLTASEDGTAALWDSHTGQIIKRLEGHTGPLVQAIYSPAGDRIATASVDTTARLWTADGSAEATLAKHTDALTSLAFSPDGLALITASRDKSAISWNLSDLSDLSTEVLGGDENGHESAVLSVGFSPDGQTVLTAAADGNVRVWQDAETNTVLRGHQRPVTWAAMLSPGLAVTTSTDETVRLWNVAGNAGLPVGTDAPPIVSARFAGSVDEILTSHDDNVARLWTADGKKIAEFKSAGSETALTFTDSSRSGHRVVASYVDGEITVWERTGATAASFKVAGDSLKSVHLSPDGESILTVEANAIGLRSLKGGIRFAITVPEGVASAQFTSDGSRIVIVTNSGAIEVRGLDGKKLYRSQERAGVKQTYVAPNGDRALQSWSSQGEDRGVISAVFGLAEGQDEQKLLSAQIKSATFSADGSLVFAATANGQGLVMDKEAKPLSTMLDLRDLEEALVISDRGQVMLGKHKGGEIGLLDWLGRRVVSFGVGTEPITSAALSPDRSQVLLVTGSKARIWPTYLKQQILVDAVKTGLPRCVEQDAVRDLYLEAATGTFCADKYPLHKGDAGKVEVSRAPSVPVPGGPALDFAYYAPGDIAGQDLSAGRSDRFVYLPDIAFPLKLGAGEHAYMNSQLFGFGGGGWAGKGAPGGSECDPRNYDPMRQRDTYCEIRSWEMPLCPSGKGKQGQNIRPPSCEIDRWEVVAVADGEITLVSSNTTVRLKANDGTAYDYLHMVPTSIKVEIGQKVKKGDVLGKVGNYMGGNKGNTTVNLSFTARKAIKIAGESKLVYVPVYSSLIAAYREQKGLPRGIDADGNLIVDPDFEIGAGKIPRPPEHAAPAPTTEEKP